MRFLLVLALFLTVGIGQGLSCVRALKQFDVDVSSAVFNCLAGLVPHAIGAAMIWPGGVLDLPSMLNTERVGFFFSLKIRDSIFVEKCGYGKLTAIVNKETVRRSDIERLAIFSHEPLAATTNDAKRRHVQTIASARARRQGPGVPAITEGSAKTIELAETLL